MAPLLLAGVGYDVKASFVSASRRRPEGADAATGLWITNKKYLVNDRPAELQGGQAKTASVAAYQAIGEELLALIEGRP